MLILWGVSPPKGTFENAFLFPVWWGALVPWGVLGNLRWMVLFVILKYLNLFAQW